jgi:hypothetical protein
VAGAFSAVGRLAILPGRYERPQTIASISIVRGLADERVAQLPG